VLTYLEGESGADGWAKVVDEAGLVAAAQLLRLYHDAVAGWRGDPDLQWADRSAGTGGDGTVVCHGDYGPWNLVWQGTFSTVNSDDPRRQRDIDLPAAPTGTPATCSAGRLKPSRRWPRVNATMIDARQDSVKVDHLPVVGESWRLEEFSRASNASTCAVGTTSRSPRARDEEHGMQPASDSDGGAAADGDLPGVDGRGSWRRGWSPVVLVAAALAGVLVVTGGVVLLRGGFTPQTAAPAPPAALEVNWPGVVEPSPEAEPLPADGPVGLAALIYRACHACDMTLLLADGRQLVLPDDDGPLVPRYSLSPDGRWLASRDESGAVVRDLTGDVVHELDGPARSVLVPWAWSPDSAWALFAVTDAVDGVKDYVLLELPDGTVAEIPAPHPAQFVGVLPTGELVAATMPQPTDGPVTALDVEVRDRQGGVVDTLTIDAAQWLAAGETLVPMRTFSPSPLLLLISPDGDGLLLAAFGEQEPELVILSVQLDGEITGRLDVPGEGFQGWRLAGLLGGELVVMQSRAAAAPPERVLALHVVSDSEVRELTRLDPAALVRIAGTAYHGGATS
jgi:hypothetical protein